MAEKRLQVDSMYEKYDTDGDGIVSDDEFAHMSEIKKLEHLGAKSQKNLMKRAILKYFE